MGDVDELDADLERLQEAAVLSVPLPSGANFLVLTQDEKKYLEDRCRRYLADNHFSNISDFADIDKLVTFELFLHRWSLWLSYGRDYYNAEIDERALASQCNTYATEIRLLKKSLGVDKPARDKMRGDDSVPNYLSSLRERAREFGIMRNTQFDKCLELFQQMKALVGFHDRADDAERRENGVTQDEIFDWIREVAIPEFEVIDKSFRDTKQRFWIRQQ